MIQHIWPFTAKLNILFPKKTKPSTLCADCNTRFSSSSNLRLHLKRKHPGRYVSHYQALLLNKEIFRAAAF